MKNYDRGLEKESNGRGILKGRYRMEKGGGGL